MMLGGCAVFAVCALGSLCTSYSCCMGTSLSIISLAEYVCSLYAAYTVTVQQYSKTS
jgi:hypothetical protein